MVTHYAKFKLKLEKEPFGKYTIGLVSIATQLTGESWLLRCLVCGWNDSDFARHLTIILGQLQSRFSE